MCQSHETDDDVCFFCEAAWKGMSQLLSLSKRETEILQCLLLGDDEEDAAKFLRLSLHTVHTHLKRIHEKLGVHSRVVLVVRLFVAHKRWHRLAPPPPGCTLSR